jgi:hypothetical protein
MKFWYLMLFGILLWGIGILPFYWIEEVNLPHRFLGVGRWLSASGYLAPYAGLGIAVVALGIVFVFVSVFSEVCRNNAPKACVGSD